MKLTRRAIGASFAAIAVASTMLATTALADSTAITFENYAPGTVNGVNGWSLANACATYDAAFSDNTGGAAPAAFGSRSLRVSNAVATNCFDQIYSPGLTDGAGETTAEDGGLTGGTRQPQFTAEFSVASQSGTGANGGAVSISPTRKDAARMSFVSLDYTAGGLKIAASDVDGTGGSVGCDCADFVTHDLGTFASNQAHTVRIEMRFLPGPSNDVVSVFVDGVKKFTGTSWEDYYRFDTESGTSGNSRTIDRLIIRPRAGGPSTVGTGMLLDNISYASGPITPYADQTITFPQPAGVTFGAPDVPLNATASSGLPVSYASTTPSVCTIVSGKAHVIGAGTCIVTASQAGNGTFLPAPSTNRSIAVAKAHTAITTTSTSSLVSILTGKVTFTSVAKSQEYGTPIVGAPVTITLDGKARCTGTTNASGVATCSTTPITIVIGLTKYPYTATTPASANYFAGSGSGAVPLL